MAENSGGDSFEDAELHNVNNTASHRSSTLQSTDALQPMSVLPWQRGQLAAASTQFDLPLLKSVEEINPGEYVLQTLFSEFTHLAEKKIDRLMKESFERPLSKSLQRGEDPQFDQLLSSLSSVAEHCLSSLLKTLFMWYERQSCHKPDDGGQRSPIRLKSGSESPRPGSRASFREKDILWERRDLAVEFIFCLVLIEVLKQLSVHPVDDLLIQYIENLAFKHFKENRPNTAPSPVTANQTIITALYAEVIGVLAQTRFQSIRKRFMQEYKDNIGNMQVLLNIIIGLKYIRIKLYPVDEVEESFLFLQECAGLFFEKNTDKEIKYAFASLFVEILIPVAATAKREYSIPAVKKFVDILYKEVFDMSKKAKHSIAMYPLVTALLCISQKQFFLTNWGGFLNMCLNSIKSRDVKMQRMAMECLYRLLWVYIIRIKCESHSLTSNRLRSIVDTLFPKNSRTIIPRNIPLTIFVKIIQFIAQEKLDFAMQDIIFDLLNIGKSIRQLNPERMNIGLRAFLVIADNLQRKEGSPPMPSTIGQLPSGNTLKVKKTFTKLTEEAARNIGVVTYYTSVRRALDNILKALDTQVGKSMTLINPQMVNKEANDMITGERKSKIDLFRTCVAAIPKCIPDGMNKIELVELVSRLTLHVDEELRNLAFAALQGLIVDFPEYRKDIIDGYIDFSLKEVQDGFPQIIENSIRMLAQMLIQWRNAVVHPAAPLTDKYLEMSMHCSKTAEDKEKHSVHTLHAVEGFALAMLCSIKAMHRKLALTLLKELRLLYKTLYPDGKEERAIDIIEGSAALVIEKALVYVSNSDKSSLGLSPQMDLQLLAEKSALLAEKQKDNISNCISRDLWSHCLAGFLDKIFSHSKHCSCSFQFTWPHINSRLFSLYSLIDPSADFDSIKSRSIISFKAPRTQANLSDLCLWRNYLIFLCCTPPTSVLSPTKTNTLTAVVNDSEIKTEVNKLPADFPRLSDIFRTAIMLIRSESYEIREAAVTGLGKTNASAHPQLIEELQPLMREVLDRKAEGVRKKRKRDLLRLQVARIFAANAEQGCFRHSLAQADNSSILQCLGEYIEGMRTILESENEKDDVSLTQLRLYFSKFLHKMIKSIPTLMQGSLLRNQGRHHLFLLLASWCGHFNVNSLGKSTKSDHHNVELELSALEAMCALLCCGQVFDQKALTVSNGYLYKLLDTMLVSTNLKVNKLGQETVELLLENNESIPALLNFVVDRCYTGERGISNGCFLALANVFSKRPYACQLIPLLCVVLFKTGDPNAEIREKAAQLICILDRRFFGYMVPFRSATAAYAYGNQAFSLQLAFTHPELTLPLLSEMTLRFESATMVGQRCLLQYLVPWLKNVELINISSGISPSTTEQEHEDYAIPENSRQLKPVSLHGDGWGSVMASQMVLNNLFYLSVKYEEYYSKEIEECWSALCVRWEKNVSEILNYLIVMAGLCGIPVLMHAKKVAVYIARAKTEEVIVELTEELKVTDIVTNFWDRIDSPPYFKSLNKCQSPPTNRPASMETSPRKQMSVDSEPETRCESPSLGLNSRTSIERLSFGSAKAFAETVLESAKASQIAEQIEQKKNETGSSELWMLRWAIKAQQMQGVGLPLPMPHELQYFAPIIQVFPVTTPPAQLYRCNFSLMLLAEIVSDRRDISWIHHLPLLLHVSFLGLDHAKPLVHENCKRLIINLLVVLVCGGDRSTIAKALMDFQTVSCTALNLTASMRSSTTNNDDGESNDDDASAKGEEEGNLIAQADVDGPELEERGLSIDERAREVIEYLAKSDCKPLWAFEDITPRNVTIKSADQLEGFLHIIMTLFDDALPHALLPGRWGREALHWATSCSSRHYAGRSFQIFRSLKVPLSWPMLSDILQRLVESVADNSDDVQGYFMEILMTFLAEVDYAFKERPKSVLEQIIIEEVTTKRSGSLQDVYNMADAELEQPQQFECNNYVGDNQHMRSQSIDIDLRGHHRMRSSSDGKKKDRRRYDSEMTLPSHVSSNPHPLTSSVSSKELTELQLPESPYDMLARLFWIGVSLLESDYEHEFLLAIKLLEKILDTLNLRSSTGIDRVERVLNKLNWNNFPGVQSLLLKGLTSFGTAEQTLGLLSKLTALTSVTVIDPAPSSGLSMNVIALLPRLIIGFEEPDEFCKSAATNIMQACGSNGNLHDLGLILTMYRDKEYSKSVQVWIEVVCKNIIDAFPQLSAQLLALLVEMLEQGPPAFQQAVLNIICAILKYADASAPGLKQFHGHLLRIITSHVKDVNLWKDSLNILKLVVSNASHIQQVNPTPVGITSSQLVQPRGSIGSLLSLGPKLPWGSNLSLGDNSWSLTSQMFKKELPGRTLEFSYNVANTPVIGAKYSQDGKDDHENGNSTASAPCWRKPHNSQRRTRERLIQLLPLCGHKGGLKQSLSVIFSSSSEIEGEHALSSENTSGDEQSGEKGEGEFSGQQLTNIFTDFDFLYDEIDEDVEIGSFGWTSTTELHDEEFVESGHISPCGSESDQVTSTKDGDASADVSADEDDPDSLQRSLTESSLRSLKEEESDVVDSPPSLPLDSADGKPPTPRPSSPENDHETPSKHPSRPLLVPKSHKLKLSADEAAGTSSPTSQSSFDSSSGVETSAVAPLQQPPDFAVLSYDEIPDRWTKLMSSFVSHPSVEEAIDSLPCFPLVLKSWSIWLLRLTREASQVLINSPIPEISGVLSKLANIEESLENELRLPYIFVDRAVFSTGKLLLKHRLTVLKLNVGLQGLHEKREQAREHLDLIQATKHEFSSEEELSELFDVSKSKPDDQTVMDFCTCLYRLHMQYVMCLELYLAYVEKIVAAVQISAQITDVTVDLVSIRSELMASQNSTNNHDDSSPGPVISFKETADLVSDAVANRHFDEAITILRAYRQRHPSLSTYEIRPDEEIETILSVYARSILKSRSGVFALLGSYEQLTLICDKLSELLADYLTVIYDRSKTIKPLEDSDDMQLKMDEASSPLSEETI